MKTTLPFSRLMGAGGWIVSRLAALALLLCLACGSGGDGRVKTLLREAEKLVDSRPDSALTLLESIPTPEKLPESEWARWALLETWARDNLSGQPRSDVAINHVVAYYDRSGNARQRAIAHFLKGQVYARLDSHLAGSCYGRALELALAEGDSALAFRCLARNGQFLFRQSYLNDAFPNGQRWLDLARRAKDTLQLAQAHFHLAEIYAFSRETSRAAGHYQAAFAYARQAGDERTARWAAYDGGLLLARQGQMGKALGMARQLIAARTERGDSLLAHSGFLLAGEIFKGNHRPDSASFFLEKAAASSNPSTRRRAYLALADIARHAGDEEKATRYTHLSEAAADSIMADYTPSAAYDLPDNLPDETGTSLWGNALRLSLAALALLASAASLPRFFRKYRQSRKNEQVLREELSTARKRADLNIRQAASLAHRLEETRENLSASQRETEALRARLKAQETEDTKARRGQTLVEALKARPRTLTDDEIGDIAAFLDRAYHSFALRLKTAHPKLSPTDLSYCYLNRLDFPVAALAIMLNVDPRTLYTRKQRVKKRLSEKLPSGMDLTEYLQNF